MHVFFTFPIEFDFDRVLTNVLIQKRGTLTLVLIIVIALLPISLKFISVEVEKFDIFNSLSSFWTS